MLGSESTTYSARTVNVTQASSFSTHDLRSLLSFKKRKDVVLSRRCSCDLEDLDLCLFCRMLAALSPIFSRACEKPLKKTRQHANTATKRDTERNMTEVN
jgi:hypothetical protein